MTYEIAIPSYKRPKELNDLTLALLRRMGVDMERVTVFLSSLEENENYCRELSEEVSVHCCSPPAKNVVDKFNTIHRAYAEGTYVVVLEDDLQTLIGMDKLELNRYGFETMVNKGFEAVDDGGIWGIAPHANAFYFSGKVTRTLKLVVAHCFGFVATDDPTLEVTQRGKSDYERTCRYFERYGEVIRIDSVGVKTKSYTAAGGMQADATREQRAQHERESCEWLVKNYPHMLRMNDKKKSLFTELSFLPCKLDVDQLAEMRLQVDRINETA